MWLMWFYRRPFPTSDHHPGYGPGYGRPHTRRGNPFAGRPLRRDAGGARAGLRRGDVAWGSATDRELPRADRA